MATVSDGLKHTVWNLVETAEGDDLASRLVDVFIVSLIVLSTILTVLDSIPGLFDSFNRWLFAFDYFVIAVFTVEYVVRIWSCTADPRYAHPIRGRLRYATSPLALVDLVAILPSYTPWFLPRGLLFRRMVRLIRLLRLFQVGRYSDTPLLVLTALMRRKAELLSALFALSLLLISAAGLLY
ncbi:MAG: ion transporter, partial [Coriobacteriia bacterium]